MRGSQSKFLICWIDSKSWPIQNCHKRIRNRSSQVITSDQLRTDYFLQSSKNCTPFYWCTVLSLWIQWMVHKAEMWWSSSSCFSENTCELANWRSHGMKADLRYHKNTNIETVIILWFLNHFTEHLFSLSDFCWCRRQEWVARVYRCWWSQVTNGLVLWSLCCHWPTGW